MREEILQIGAEAIILRKQNEVVKRRLKKSYRIPEIDEKIRKQRTKAEGKLLEKASKIIPIPKIKKIDERNKEIIMDFAEGARLSDSLDSFSIEKQKKICRQIGEQVAALHDADIIHGDLTTSNMILVGDIGNKDSVNKKIINNNVDNKKRGDKSSYEIGYKKDTDNKNFKIYFIDFGLGFISHKVEDKAVDLHLFKEALEARHFQRWQILFAEFLKSYSASKHSKKVLEQLKKVEKRGRYKKQY